MALSRAEGALEEARHSRSALEARLERTQAEMRSAEAQLAEAGIVARELRQALPQLQLPARAFSEEPRRAGSTAARAEGLHVHTPPRDLLFGLVGRLQEMGSGRASPAVPVRRLETEDRFGARNGRISPRCGTPVRQSPGRMTPERCTLPVQAASASPGSMSFSTEAAIDSLERQMLSIASQNAVLEERIKRNTEPRADGAPLMEVPLRSWPNSGGSSSVAAPATAASTPIVPTEVRSPIRSSPKSRRSMGDAPLASCCTTTAGSCVEPPETLGCSHTLPAPTEAPVVRTPFVSAVERIPSRSPQKTISYSLPTPMMQRRWHITGAATPTAGGPPGPPPLASAAAAAARAVAAASVRSSSIRGSSPARMTSQRATVPSDPAGCMGRAHFSSSTSFNVGAWSHVPPSAAGPWPAPPPLPGGASPTPPPMPSAQQVAPPLSTTVAPAPVPAGAAQAHPLSYPMQRPRSPSIAQRSPRSSPRGCAEPSLSWAPASTASLSCMPWATATAVHVPLAHSSAMPLSTGPARPGALQSQLQHLQQHVRSQVCA